MGRLKGSDCARAGVVFRPPFPILISRHNPHSTKDEIPMNSLSSVSKCWYASTAVVLLLAAAASADVIVVQEQTQAAIQTALNRVRPPGTVVLPPGRYPLDTRDAQGRLVPLRVRNSDITLQGAGMDQTVLFRANEDDDPGIIAMVRSTGFARVRITGIRF